MIKIIHFFKNNSKIKIICLLSAALLWGYVVSVQNSIAKFPGSIQVKAINALPGLVPVFDTKTVEIKVMTESGTLKTLTADSFTAYMDLSGYSSGTHEVPINVVTSIGGVKVVEKSPDTQIVSLEPVAVKNVGISKKIEGSAFDGFTVGSVSFSPETVSIKGAKSAIDNINEVVAIIRLDDQKESYEDNIILSVADVYQDRVEITPREIRASISLVRGANSKTVGIKPVLRGSPAENYYISNIIPIPSTVTVNGAVNPVSLTKSLETLPIDVTGLDKSVSKKVALILPEGVYIDREDELIEVQVEIELINQIRELSTSNFNLINAADISVLSYQPSEIKIKFIADPALLNLIKPSDFVVNLDFSTKKIKSGDSVIFEINKSNVDSPAGVRIIEISSSRVTIKIQ